MELTAELCSMEANKLAQYLMNKYPVSSETHDNYDICLNTCSMLLIHVMCCQIRPDHFDIIFESVQKGLTQHLQNYKDYLKKQEENHETEVPCQLIEEKDDISKSNETVLA